MGLMPVVIGQECDFGEFKWQTRVISWVIVIFQIYSGIEQVRKCQREGCER